MLVSETVTFRSNSTLSACTIKGDAKWNDGTQNLTYHKTLCVLRCVKNKEITKQVKRKSVKFKTLISLKFLKFLIRTLTTNDVKFWFKYLYLVSEKNNIKFHEWQLHITKVINIWSLLKYIGGHYAQNRRSSKHQETGRGCNGTRKQVI